MYDGEPTLPAITSPTLMPIPSPVSMSCAAFHRSASAANCSSIELCGQDRAFGSIRLLDRHAEADHQAVARHVEDGAVVLERDVGEQREEFIQQLDDLGGLRRSEMPVKPRMSANITAAWRARCVPENIESRSSGFSRIRSASLGEM